MINYLVLLFSLLLVSCSTLSVPFANLEEEGKILKEYKVGNERIVVLKKHSTNIYTKYRLFFRSAGEGINRVEVEDIDSLYSVDTSLHVCLALSVEIPCEKLKRDPDLGEFITWLGAKKTEIQKAKK